METEPEINLEAITNWLVENHSTRFHEYFYDPARSQQIEIGMKKARELDQQMQHERDEKKRLLLEKGMLEALLDVAHTGSAQQANVYLATVGLLLKQLLKYGEPELPNELIKHLDFRYRHRESVE